MFLFRFCDRMVVYFGEVFSELVRGGGLVGGWGFCFLRCGVIGSRKVF